MLLCSSECDKISNLPSFYVDEKFTHQVIYLNTKSSIFLCQGENLHIKFITLLSVANFFSESTYLLIKFLALIKFLIFVRNTIFPCLHNFVEGIKKYMSSLYFHKSRRPGDDPVKRARAVWKLRALKFNMAVTMNFFTTWRNFLKLFCRYVVQPKQRMFGITRWISSGVPIEKIRTI